MRVLNWVQTRLRGAHCSKKASEFSASSAPQVADTSSELRREDVLQGGWPTAGVMLSIGTLGVGEGHRDDVKKLQEELTLLMRARGTEDDGKMRHLPMNRSLNEGMAKQRSFRKLVSSVFNGFLSRPSLRETVPELRATENPLPLLNKGTHPEKLASSKAVIKSDRKAQMLWKGAHVMGEDEEQGSRWIRTDSEYIVLEI